MSEHEMAAMREQIEAERSRLREEKDMAEEERDRAEAALRRHEAELGRAQSDHDAMKQKLAALEKKIIVGGENLLDKVCAQFSLFQEGNGCMSLASMRTGDTCTVMRSLLKFSKNPTPYLDQLFIILYPIRMAGR